LKGSVKEKGASSSDTSMSCPLDSVKSMVVICEDTMAPLLLRQLAH